MSGEREGDQERDRKRRKLPQLPSSPSDKDEGEDPKGEANKQISVPFTPENYADFLEFFECPVCNVSMFSGPIIQCPEGHIICDECKDGLPNPKKCPQCRKKLGNSRNRVLEAMVEKIPMHCKNKEFGCPLIVSKSDRMTHAEQCKFVPLDCPYDCLAEKSERDCEWVGSLQQLDAHWKDSHGGDGDFLECVDATDEQWTIYADENEDFTVKSEFVALACVSGHRFVLIAQCFSDCVRMRILHVGNEAFGHCTVRLALKNHHNVVFTGPIQSYRESNLWLSAHPSVVDSVTNPEHDRLELTFRVRITL